MNHRPKIRWVILGALWALGCFLFADTYEATAMFATVEGWVHLRLPEWLLNLLYAQSFWLPAAVFDAIRHYRVIKVRFAIARVLVFPAFVTLIAIAVKLAEMLIEYLLSQRFEWVEGVRQWSVVVGSCGYRCRPPCAPFRRIACLSFMASSGTMLTRRSRTSRRR